MKINLASEKLTFWNCQLAASNATWLFLSTSQDSRWINFIKFLLTSLTRFLKIWFIDVRMTLMSVRIDTLVSSFNLDCFVNVPIDALFSNAQPIAKKACDLDPLPACPLSTNLCVLVPVILRIANLWLKENVLKPSLKKQLWIRGSWKIIAQFLIWFLSPK